MVLIGDCDHKGSIAPFIPTIKICSSDGKHFDKGEVVGHSCQLQGVVSVFLVDCTINREAVVKHLGNFCKIVGGDGTQHTEAV